jgi:DNA replication protein DnaC
METEADQTRTPAGQNSEPRNVLKPSFYEARMRRRGFDPFHVALPETPPHAGYDALFDRILASCGQGMGKIFALYGIRGTGKTQLVTNVCGRLLEPRGQEEVCECVRRYMRARMDDEETWPLYTTAREFFRAIKASWNPPNDGRRHDTEIQVLEHFLKPCVLVVDEAHVRSESKWEDDQLTELVDRRCYSGRDTLLNSNLTRTAFCAALGPSIVSRIQEKGAMIEFKWESFRGTPR